MSKLEKFLNRIGVCEDGLKRLRKNGRLSAERVWRSQLATDDWRWKVLDRLGMVRNHSIDCPMCSPDTSPYSRLNAKELPANVKRAYRNWKP